MQKKGYTHFELLAFILLCFVFNISNGQTKEAEFVKLKKRIEKAYYSFDVKLLSSLLKYSQSSEKKYKSSWYPQYYSGIICLQIGKILYLPNPDKAYAYFDKSIDYFFEAKEKKYNAELAALISAAYGKISSLSTIKAIYYGIKARNYIYDANELDSINTEVYLIAATHLMHTPESFGGDKIWAEDLLKKALKLNYTKERKNGLTINWAEEPEIYAYLAQLEILSGNKDKAQLYIDKALELVPDYGFVLFDLVPQLKKLK
ncbi:hypothetical protein ACFLSQ_06365 [Bacteroidota bacterium]